jgi:hypothetical protein
MHTSTASREVTGKRAAFVGAAVALVGRSVVTVVITVSGGGEGVADVKTNVGTTVGLDESFSGLRVYDTPELIDTLEVCGSLSQTSRVL